MSSSQQIIDQTIAWIQKVVIGCNFCPFAARPVQQQRIHYQVEDSTDTTVCLDAFFQEITRLDKDPHIETSFLIFSNAFPKFDDYLDMVSMAEHLLKEKGYEGVYQLASFHPTYRFASSTKNDAANYTNRSIYPMLQFIRESSIDKALAHYENPENIPERNVDFARKKGLTFMKLLRDSCLASKLFLLLLMYACLSVHANPFKINFPQKKDLTFEDYIEVQKQIGQIDILPLVRDMYAGLDGTYFTSFEDITGRCSKCIRQTLIDPANGRYPQKELVKIGRGSDNCFVCCGPLNGKYPYYVKSLIETLERQGFDGYFLYYIGGWPNPTGEEILYTAVPYCFKIFAMVEAHQMGFNKVLWVDAACLPLGDMQPLFDRIDKEGALLNWSRPSSTGKRYIFPQTHDLLLDLTGTDVHKVPYINTIVFGLKMNTPEARKLIRMYYEFVRLGTPFLSCFPEEWVLTAIIGKKRFRDWTESLPPKLVGGSKTNANNSPAEFSKVREKGFYFYHRKGR